MRRTVQVGVIVASQAWVDRIDGGGRGIAAAAAGGQYDAAAPQGAGSP
jgi:hypothetical protein